MSILLKSINIVNKKVTIFNIFWLEKSLLNFTWKCEGLGIGRIFLKSNIS